MVDCCAFWALAWRSFRNTPIIASVASACYTGHALRRTTEWISMVHPTTQDSRAFARRPIANRNSHSLAAATAAVLRAGSACCGCVEGFRPRCRAAVMAPQDPNIIADSVRSRLVTVERTCRSLTASVGPFKDPHHVRSQIRTMVVELERAVIDGQRGYRGTKVAGVRQARA